MAMIITVTFLLIALTAACAALWKKQTRPDSVSQGFILIPCTEDTEELEMTVRSAYWGEMLESSERRRGILIVLIEAKENGFTARRLASELPGVEAVDISALNDRILRTIKQDTGEQINERD